MDGARVSHTLNSQAATWNPGTPVSGVTKDHNLLEPLLCRGLTNSGNREESWLSPSVTEPLWAAEPQTTATHKAGPVHPLYYHCRL